MLLLLRYKPVCQFSVDLLYLFCSAKCKTLALPDGKNKQRCRDLKKLKTEKKK